MRMRILLDGKTEDRLGCEFSLDRKEEREIRMQFSLDGKTEGRLGFEFRLIE